MGHTDWDGQKKDTHIPAVGATKMDKWKAGKDGIGGEEMQEKAKPKGLYTVANGGKDQANMRRPW